MGSETIDVIAKLLDLGTAGVVLVILWFYRKDTQTKINEQDRQIKDTNDNSLAMVEKMTQVTAGVKAALDNNTKAMESLPERIDYILRKSK